MKNKVELPFKIRMEKVSSLIGKEWKDNPRLNDKASDSLVKVLEANDFIDPIVKDQWGTIRAGHTRLKSAVKMKTKYVPVITKKFRDKAHAEAYAVSDNKSSEFADWDHEKLIKALSSKRMLAFKEKYKGGLGYSIEQLEAFNRLKGVRNDNDELPDVEISGETPNNGLVLVIRFKKEKSFKKVRKLFGLKDNQKVANYKDIKSILKG